MEKMIFDKDFRTTAPVPSAIHLRLNAAMRQQYARVRMAAMLCGYTFPDGTPFNGSIQHVFRLLFAFAVPAESAVCKVEMDIVTFKKRFPDGRHLFSLGY